MLRKSSLSANQKYEKEDVPAFGMARKMSDEWLHEKNTDDAADESPSCKIVIQAESAESESALKVNIKQSE